MYRYTNNYQRPRNKFFSQRRKLPVYDPNLFIKRSAENISEDYTPTHSFLDFQIHSVLKQNISSKGYKDPTPIQDRVIPILLEGKNVVGIATTGTGKTNDVFA